MIEKKISRCGESYYYPTQAWIHAFCMADAPCVAIEYKDTGSLKERRQKAYAKNRSYGIEEARNDSYVDADVDAERVDATGAVDNVDHVDASTASTETDDRAKRLKSERMKRWRSSKPKG